MHEKRATSMNPRLPDILLQGLRAHQHAGDQQGAQRLYREALDMDPAHPDALHLLGVSLFQSGDIVSGIDHLRRATALRPTVAAYHMNLGNALSDSGQYEEALKVYAVAQTLSPQDSEVRFNIGNTQRRLGRLDQAVTSLDQAIELRADFFEALDLLGRVHAELGRVDLAQLCYDKVIAGAGYPGTRVRKAMLLPPVVESEENIEYLRQRLLRSLDELSATGLQLRDPLAEVGTTQFYVSYHGKSNKELNSRIAQFYLGACPDLNWTAPHCAKPRTPAGKIRVGFISRFFHEHSIGKTSHGLIEELSRADFSVVALFVPPRVDDAMSRRIAKAADESHTLPRDLAGAREAIAALELDILFYQDVGTEPFTYFLAFSRLAPVQCVSFGHPDTTGIPNMDYFISSALYETENSRRDYSEELVMLENAGTLAYYQWPPFVTDVGNRGEVGLPEGSHVYLCPQSFFKLHPRFDTIVDGILRRDPLGIVILIAPEHNDQLVALQERLRRSVGGLIGRVGVVPRRNRHEFLRLLKGADVVLDTPEFNGMNSSLEAFSCGVPVVTLAGDWQRARHTLGMYRKMEYMNCVARDVSHYVEIAVRLATDPAVRENARQTILARCGRLFEDRNIVSGFEGFFRAAIGRAMSGEFTAGGKGVSGEVTGSTKGQGDDGAA
jgi:protein O-GlcNAc transferase